MEITITNVKYAPSWNALQAMIRDMTGDEKATFTRIQRRDKGVNYRGTGVYDVTIRKGDDELPLVLTVSGPCPLVCFGSESNEKLAC